MMGRRLVRPAFLTVVVVTVAAGAAQAQTMGAWNTRPLPPAQQGLQPAIPMPPVRHAVTSVEAPAPRGALSVQPNLTGPLGPTPPDADGLPVVMFRARPPLPRLDLAVPATRDAQERRYSISWQAERDAASALGVQPSAPDSDPATVSLDRQVAVQFAPDADTVRDPRGPFRRIYEDTRTAVVRDLPEAFAHALPWVDRAHKDKPLDAVLAEVSDDLSRAAASDPEWAKPAEDELRELARRLRGLSAPPPHAQARAMAAVAPPAEQGRPFRPRPVWPGASASATEPQSRPLAITTGTPDETGPATRGHPGLAEPDPEPAAASAPPSTRRPARANRRR